MIKNEIFRWAALALAILFLVVFWQESQNGRYVLVQGGEYNPPAVIDTRTGHVFIGAHMQIER